jgi:hypothetical protein
MFAKIRPGDWGASIGYRALDVVRGAGGERIVGQAVVHEVSLTRTPANRGCVVLSKITRGN